MKKSVKLVGLDCPNCARSLENEISKLNSVKNVHIDFVKNRLYFESDDTMAALDEIIKLTKRLEPQAQISEINSAERKNKLNLILDITFLAVGIAIGFVIFFVSMPKWCYWTLYVLSALLLGYKTYLKAIRLLFKGIINENLLITISVVGASIISQHMEGLMVIALYSIGKIFEGLAVNRSRKSIEKLASLQPEYANLILNNGEVEKVQPSSVKIGDMILVKAGEKVPLDGKVVEGETFLDLKSLTGESLPVKAKEGDEILSGSVVVDGVITIEVTSVYENSAVSKIMNLVENAAENKSKTETFVSKITKWYTLAIIVLALSVWGIVWAVTKDLNSAFYRGLIFLVVSCPCAFAISVPLSYFSGLGNASKNGVLIKGSNFLDACAGLKTIAFDKTGTLTTGQFEIDKITSFGDKKEDELLFVAALGEQYSLHPLAQAITKSCIVKLPKLKSVKEIAGEGVEFVYKKKNYFVGRKNDNLTATCVEIYENDEKIGEISLSDKIKPSAKDTCKGLNDLGVKTVLLSGDNTEIAQDVAKQVGINEALGKLLPQDKYEYLKKCKDEKIKIGYVGDGINDAPALTLADVGISMGINGAPASIEASDVVLVDDDPQKIISLIKISKFTKLNVIENISLAAIIKLTFLSLGAAGVTGMLAAVFADVGVTLLAILNSMRVLKYKPNKKQNIKNKK